MDCDHSRACNWSVDSRTCTCGAEPRDTPRRWAQRMSLSALVDVLERPLQGWRPEEVRALGLEAQQRSTVHGLDARSAARLEDGYRRAFAALPDEFHPYYRGAQLDRRGT